MNLSPTIKENPSQDKSSKVAQNLLWMVWSGAISIANSMLIWIFLARLREPEELGRFTIVMGLYALFYSVCSLGLMPFLVSEISRRSEQKSLQTVAGFISSASVFLLISGTICAILMAASGFLVSDSWSVRVSTLILSLAMIPTGVIAVGEATAISFGRTRLIAFATTLENILRTLVPFGLIWFGFDIWTICLSFVGVRIVALIVYLSALGSRISLFAFNKADFIKSLNVSPTFAGTIILSSLNWQAAIILLAHLSTEVESAKYGVASRFLIPVTILMASYANVIQPVIARYTQNSAANIALYLSRMASYPLILATLGAIASPFLSPTVLVMLFGDKYADAAPTLDVVALSVVPFCLVIVVARGLVAANSQHIDLFANALGVITSILAGLILIPKYGAWGAALAQLFSLLLMALIEIGYLSKKVIGFSVWRTASLSLGSLLIIYAFLWKL